MARALVFPGQGSQQVGMGRSLCDVFAEAREVFQEVDDAVNTKLSQVIFEGPEDALKMTENTQPALMAVSMAVVRVLEKQGTFRLPEAAKFVAGHSVWANIRLCVQRVV